MSKFIFDSKEVNSFFKHPKDPTVKCAKCEKLYKADDEFALWEYKDWKTKEKSKYFGLCRECYKKALNDNLTESDIRYYAEFAIDHASSLFGGYNRSDDLSDEAWNYKVLPMIDKILAERKEKEEKLREDAKYKEAIQLYESARKDAMLDDNLMTHIIAKLLIKIEDLEKKISHNDIYRMKFDI